MKNLVTALVLMFAVSASAQETQLTGCFGVSFGCTRQAVKEMMKLKHPNAVLVKDEGNVLGYKGDRWIGKSVALWVFGFTAENEMYTGSVSIELTVEEEIFDSYDEMLKSMSTKYGEGESFSSWKYPYTADDKESHGVTAIKVGKAEFSTYWQFNSNQPDLHNFIEISITTSVRVMVKYQDGILVDKYLKEKSKKDQSEM